MKKILYTIVCVMMMTGLIGCGKEEENSLKVAYFPNITHSQALVMKNQGTLEEKLPDCEVTWTAFNAGPAEVEAIFAGEVNIGYIGPIPAISANVKSSGDVAIIAGAANAGAELVTRKDAKIASVKDLDGKKVAVPQFGNTQHLSLLNLLSENGLADTGAGGTVEIVASENADILNLMQQGEIDAALVPEPWGSTLENYDEVEMLLDFDEIWLEGNYPTAVVVVNKDYLENHPEEVKAFVKAHLEVTDYINSNIEESIEIVNDEIMKATGKQLDAAVIKKAFGRMIIQAEIPEEAIRSFADVDLKEGFIKELPGEDLIDKTLLDEMMKESEK